MLRLKRFVETRHRLFYTIGILMMICGGLSSCVYNSEEELMGMVEMPCEADSITYENHIAPILESRCTSCHSASFSQAGVALDSYESTLEEVSDYAENSLLYQVVATGDMPRNGPPLSDCEVQQIKSWIDAGAPRNFEEKITEQDSTVVADTSQTMEPSDTTTSNATVTYFDASVQPILQQHCLSCHNSSSPTAGVSFSTYQSTMNVVGATPEASLLYTEVESGSMPRNSAPLSPEEIQTIKKWIEDGAPESAQVSMQ